jgi:hypothetical protein
MVYPGFVTYNDPGQKGIKTLQQFRRNGFPLILWSAVRLRGTHFEQTFEYPSVSIIAHALPVLFECCIANCRVVMRRSAQIMASAQFNMSGVLAVAGWPAHSRSQSLVSVLPDTFTLLAHCPIVLL